MLVQTSKECKKCGKLFTFWYDDEFYHTKRRFICDECKDQWEKEVHHGSGAKTQVKPKKKSRKQTIPLKDMDAFAKSIGKSYGQTVALIEAGMIEYKPVKVKKYESVPAVEPTATKPSYAEDYLNDVSILEVDRMVS